MRELVTAVGLVLVLEGLLYAVAPATARRMLESIENLSEDRLRMGGLVAVAIGVAVVWLGRKALLPT
jgi:uncharacterized protein YjeT (DUF2065 family)